MIYGYARKSSEIQKPMLLKILKNLIKQAQKKFIAKLLLKAERKSKPSMNL
ncbi:hypothetical protein CHCC14559_2457 [Bacillus licheniformis]|nr:hypothetical protein [Bacillus licheniformis]TWN17904.1 hypothetical protein CHCC14562_2741 [Bacillus licheniformis]TWN28230.1 hypothetical protein CHCC14559_2457 [Bacillus licheniformis]